MSVSEQPGATWGDAFEVFQSEKFNTILKIRLTQIALDPNTGGSAAIRAIEMLLGLGREGGETGLENIPTDELEMAEYRVRAMMDDLHES